MTPPAAPRTPRALGDRVAAWTGAGLGHVVLLVIGLFWLIPSLGLLMTSFRSRADIAASGWWRALAEGRLGVENYIAVLTRGDLPPPGFARNFLNSFIITVPSTILPVIVAALAAYAIVFTGLRLRNAIYLGIVALLVVPLQITWIPVLQIFNEIGLTGSWLGIWLAHAAYGTCFAVFLLRNFFVEIPEEVIEAARADGAEHVQVFLRIVLPLSLPALASLAIFQFVWVWNDLMNALIFLQDKSKYPLTVGVQTLLGQYGNEWHLLSAGAWLTISVPLIVFFALQRYFVRGLTAGAVKG